MSIQEKKRKPLRKFRLRRDVAPHYEPNPNYDTTEPESEDNPRHYEILPGKTVESRRPLVRLFVNKFEPMEGSEDRSKIQSAGGDIPEDPDNDPDLERPVRSVEDAMVRRADRHLTEEELEGKPKHQKLARGRRTKNQELASKMGEDVTDDFEGAREADYRVYKKGSKYTIADADEPTKPLKKGLRESKVKAALEKLNEKED